MNYGGVELIKSFKLLKIIEWLEEMGIENYSIRPDHGIVDVDGSVDLDYKNLTSIPVQFGKVKGYFSCNRNQLTSLVGAPREVSGAFYCSRNQLTSLEGAPEKVCGDFYCGHNKVHLQSKY